MSVLIGILLIVASIVMIVTVLLQSSERSGLGAVSGAAETFFGKTKGKSLDGILDKLTAVLGALGLGLELAVGNPSDEPQAEQLGIGEPAARDDASAGVLSILTGGVR